MTETRTRDARTRAVEAFLDHFGASPRLLSRAPGRVNLLGGHVDYNDGFVLPVAIDRAVWVAASPRADGRVRVVAADLDDTDVFEPASVRREGPGWHNYVRGVAAVLGRSGVGLRGADLTVAGDVPVGRGLSSSAALEVAVALALLATAGGEVERALLARLCREAEEEWAGVRCGIMDQFTASLAAEGHALFLDCRSLAYNLVPLPRGLALVVCDSRAPRRLADSAYNRRRRECEEAARLLGVGSLRDVGPDDLRAREDRLPEPLRRRARHVVGEIARTREGAASLLAGDPAAVGEAMVRSHESLRDDYEVSSPELDALVEAALEVEGTYGSRLTGAGFGGCTVSLVAEEAVGEFVASVTRRYRERTGREATVWRFRAASGGEVVEAGV